ncbi:hypothetical protein ACFE04_006618 [Oxalis oulophora]
MGRLKLGWIEDNDRRIRILNNVRVKMFREIVYLNVLPRVMSCVMIKGPGELEPTFLPTRELVERLSQRMQRSLRVKKDLNPESFLENYLAKMNVKLEKSRKANLEKQIIYLFSQVENNQVSVDELSDEEIQGLLCFVKENMEAFGKRLENLRKAEDQGSVGGAELDPDMLQEFIDMMKINDKEAGTS